MLKTTNKCSTSINQKLSEAREAEYKGDPSKGDHMYFASVGLRQTPRPTLVPSQVARGGLNHADVHEYHMQNAAIDRTRQLRSRASHNSYAR